MRPGHNYIGHNYIGHNYIGHNDIGHNYIGHNYIGHNSSQRSDIRRGGTTENMVDRTILKKKHGYRTILKQQACDV